MLNGTICILGHFSHTRSLISEWQRRISRQVTIWCDFSDGRWAETTFRSWWSTRTPKAWLKPRLQTKVGRWAGDIIRAQLKYPWARYRTPKCSNLTLRCAGDSSRGAPWRHPNAPAPSPRPHRGKSDEEKKNPKKLCCFYFQFNSSSGWRVI